LRQADPPHRRAQGGRRLSSARLRFAEPSAAAVWIITGCLLLSLGTIGGSRPYLTKAAGQTAARVNDITGEFHG
ncbi:hypothetical protein, partial [Serratia marcescens]|uniref:hypothetical protein n=1 Tax=Serratia marcescens TaxID=615 RepID=UPI001953D1B3